MTTPELVAIIDDDERASITWRENLEKAGIKSLVFHDQESFLTSLSQGIQFDAVVLDWHLQGDSSVIAKAVLENLRTRYFVPVLVYTEMPDRATDEVQALQSPFNRIQVVGKGEELSNALSNWYVTTGARIARVWRRARNAAFERTLYELDALENQQLYVTLLHLVSTEDTIVIDVDHALDFLERFVGRKVTADPSLRGVLAEVLNMAEKPTNKEKRKIGQNKALAYAHRYIPLSPHESIIRTGDVVDIFSHPDDQLLLTAVVITPACDLEQKKCRELRLLIAEESPTETTTGEKWWGLRSILRDGNYVDYWLNFHRILTLSAKASNSPESPESQQTGADSRVLKPQGVLTYGDWYADPFDNQVCLRPVARLDDPYRSDLIQKFASHASRIGIPD